MKKEKGKSRSATTNHLFIIFFCFFRGEGLKLYEGTEAPCMYPHIFSFFFWLDNWLGIMLTTGMKIHCLYVDSELFSGESASFSCPFSRFQDEKARAITPSFGLLMIIHVFFKFSFL